MVKLNNKNHQLRRGIYILPNLFTLGNLGAGFFSIMNSFSSNFVAAGWAILVAVVFDILDGQTARLTKTTSKFGIEFDSLADVISFGVAPAVLMYSLVLHRYGKVGMLVAFLFVVGGALRLAKFNVKAGEGNITYYSGLPIPAAGGILATFVVVYSMWAQETSTRTIPVIMKNVPLLYKFLPLTILILSYLMISNLRYASFKVMRLDKRKSLRVFVLIIVVSVIVWMYPENMILIILAAYILSGILDLFWRVYQLQKSKILKNHNRH
ncbi:MAG: CDP-diacylglycerol--serine O-phosphatidyltransferase [bacterium]